MSDRDRLIAIVVGVLVACLVLFGGYRMIAGGFAAKQNRLRDARDKLTAKQREYKIAEHDQKTVGDFQLKTLTSNLGLAQREFQNWLEQEVKESGLSKTSFNFQGLPRTKKKLKQLTYLVQGTGDVEQITDLLHRIQTADTLHRIRTLDLRRKKDGIEMTARIDVVSLPDTNAKKVPIEKVAIGTINETKLPLSLDEYQASIVSRNMFDAANEAPRFESLDRITVEVGSNLSERIEATDPDEHELEFELGQDAPDWLEITKSGRLKGRPKEEGRFKFKVYCTDRGIPAKETVGELTLRVVPAKKEEPEEKPERFDSSKLAVVTAIRQGGRDPRPHFCLHLRDKDEMKYLMEGDELKVGKWEGQVTEVDPDTNTVVLQTEEEEYELRLGYPLSEARRIERVPVEPKDKAAVKLKDV